MYAARKRCSGAAGRPVTRAKNHWPITAKSHDDSPEQQPNHVRHREEETEEGRQARAATGRRRRRGAIGCCRGRRRADAGSVGSVVGYVGVTSKQIRIDLGRVAQAIRDDVPKAERHLAAREAGEPAEERNTPAQDAAADRKRAAVTADPPPLTAHSKKSAGSASSSRKNGRSRPCCSAGVELDVDRIARRRRGTRERVRGERQIRADVGRVPDKRDVEVSATDRRGRARTR